MAVYFITELEGSECEPLRIKIGRSANIRRRMSDLQTGNPDELALMGEIRTQGISEDKKIEHALHKIFSDQRIRLEWFGLSANDVIDALKSYSSMAFITVGSEPFEIISYDRDAIPEYASPWAWGDVEAYEFCPCCGWAGGWSYNENYGGERCLKCGEAESHFEHPY